LKHKVFSYVASASFRAMASQLSGYREKRILQNPEAKLTPKTRLESQGLFFCYFCQNMAALVGPKIFYAALGTFQEGTAAHS